MTERIPTALNLAQRGKAFKLDAWKHVLHGVYGANRGNPFYTVALAATDSLVDRNLMVVQDGADCALQGRSRFDIGAFGNHHGGSGLGQVALVLNDEETGGCAHLEFGLLAFQCFLLPRL